MFPNPDPTWDQRDEGKRLIVVLDTVCDVTEPGVPTLATIAEGEMRQRIGPPAPDAREHPGVRKKAFEQAIAHLCRGATAGNHSGLDLLTLEALRPVIDLLADDTSIPWP